AGYVVHLRHRRAVRLGLLTLAAAIVPLGLALSALTTLVDRHYGGVDLQGLAVLGVAAVYVVLGAIAFLRDRDLSSLMWALGLVVAAGAEAELVGGVWLVLV